MHTQLLEDAGEQQQPPLQAPPVALTTEQANIPGLLVLHDFVSAAQEAQLLAHIEQQPWQHLAKRRVQHYGYVFEYSQRGVDLKQQAGAIPPWSHDLVQRLQVCGCVLGVAV
jgi:alkylated DNA repair protein alkB family protein 8